VVSYLLSYCRPPSDIRLVAHNVTHGVTLVTLDTLVTLQGNEQVDPIRMESDHMVKIKRD